MFTYMARLDRAVIENMWEPAAHWLERTTGFTNFDAARFGCMTWLCATLSMPLIVSGTSLRVVWAVIAGAALVFAPMMFGMIANYERDAERFGAASRAKHATFDIAFRWFLVIFVTPHIFIEGVTPWAVGSSAYWALLCLLACDRPPPMREPHPLNALPQGAS